MMNDFRFGWGLSSYVFRLKRFFKPTFNNVNFLLLFFSFCAIKTRDLSLPIIALSRESEIDEMHVY